MEVGILRRLWLRTRLACSRGLDALANAVEELAFRVVLAWRVLTGRVPIQAERR